MGCFTFVATLFIGPVFAGGVDRFFAGYTGGDLQRFAICCIVISLGFYVPALIYYNEKLAPWLKTLIHTLIGMPVFLLHRNIWQGGWKTAPAFLGFPDCSRNRSPLVALCFPWT